MTLKNDAHKGGSKTKNSGTTKSGQGTKGTTYAKGGQASPKQGSHGAQGGQGTKGGVGTKGASHAGGQASQAKQGGHGTKGGQGGHGKGGARSWQPQEIKSLVRNQGRASLGGQEWALKAPSWSDSALQAIITDPKFSVAPAGKPASAGKWTYELRGHGKTLNVTIGS
jgi:hypothetical protein